MLIERRQNRLFANYVSALSTDALRGVAPLPFIGTNTDVPIDGLIDRLIDCLYIGLYMWYNFADVHIVAGASRWLVIYLLLYVLFAQF